MGFKDSRFEETVYVTKYSDTKGILVFQGGWTYTSADGVAYFTNARPGTTGMFLGPKDWTTDRSEAVRRHGVNIQKKITSAKKKLQKLEREVIRPTFIGEE